MIGPPRSTVAVLWKILNASEAPADLISPLSRDECAKRLRDSVDSGWSPSGRRSVVGSISGNMFRGRQRISYKNSFQTEIVATLSQDGGKTRIHCRFGMAAFTTVFTTLWFGGVILIGGSIFAPSVIHLINTTQSINALELEQLVGTAAPLLMLAFGIGLICFGRWLSRDERGFLIEFMRTTLEATVTQDPATPF